mmetsp:Transcript_24582/g.21758  ORF Transcript_24582/g.21758 Transcript_24582/m.21758 type:complete len:125 (-) Transcript_24582:666-1040(-)|eukprot:CAMPEP_0114584696 /NCGR_PEP_ID=MMETSP0125-20121206/8355_1 /TAXON_ID=485358 ORGANISM="Aristerostoma sp., Strain ATCC 50986" /NCGR_SAMPLE_ID=MMETSP0125 /ASSEMBLY_ACC=CAM_ASM_000245 /LENGTH=124 /DNA_ID=CAMNT_0001779263 /DNA_START=1804 /DNA_END=2178 /DNA_ORIENTATION=-
MNECEMISNLGLNKGVKALQYLQSLEHLDLEIKREKSLDKSFFLLLMSFLAAINPRNLRLHLTNIKEIPLDAYNQGYHTSLSKFKNLKRLDLDLFNQYCDNTQLFDMADLMKKNKNIEELKLNF